MICSYDIGSCYHLTYVKTTAEPEQRLICDKYFFTTSKSFANLFYEGKQKLVERLDFFLNNPDYYKKRGIAHSLGLLFHGAPGNP